MGYKCMVPNCTSGYSSNKEKISLFKVTEKRIEKWAKVIPRKDRAVIVGDYVCAKHFAVNDIITELKTKEYTIPLLHPKLAETAIPSIFPGCPKYLSKICTKRRPLQKYQIGNKRQKTDSGCNSTFTDNDLSPTDLFDIIWNLEKVPKLPARSWAIHYCSSPLTESRLISMTENIIVNHNTVESKKVVLLRSDVKFYILDNIVSTESSLGPSNITTLEDLEDALHLFHSLPFCFGGMNTSSSPPNFKSTCFTIDPKLNVWRHKNCSFVEKLSRTKDGQYKCEFCKSISRAIRNFKAKVKRGNKYSTQKSFQRKLSDRKAKCQRRLKTKVEKLKSELNTVKTRFQEIDENAVLSRIDEEDNLGQSQKLLIAECIRQCKFSKKTSRRYTSNWLLLCLLLHIRSPTSYKFLRNNEILPLPAISTIRRYLSRVHLKCGLDEKFLEAFKIKMMEKNQYERHGMVIFDEMQVKKAVNLHVKTLKLVGLQDFGATNILTAKSTDKIADHALVFMFTSLTENFSQPIAVYAAKGPTQGTCLAQLIMAVIKALENCGAIVDGVVCDGATTNRKLWSEFGVSGKLRDTTNKIIHPMDETRHLFFFSDAPHLMKCIRNRLFNRSTLSTPEGVVKWQDYVTLHRLDAKLPGNLRVCPKISEMHIRPSNLMKMRVKLATQIFSNAVVDGLKFYKCRNSELKDCNATITFTKRMNDLFDALNRRYSAEGIRINSKDFETLQQNLIWLNEYEQMVNSGMITKNDFLTTNTAEGLRVSILSTVELAKYLLESCSFSYVLSGKMNQDPLEQFFGTIRQAGGANDHPTFFTFLQLYRMLSVFKLLKPPVFGNCTILEEQSAPSISPFEDFKNIFTDDGESERKKQLRSIKEKIGNLSSVDGDGIHSKTEMTLTAETEDCIVYYLSGFICKKLWQSSQCSKCKEYLFSTKPKETIAEAELTILKSRGFLNHPNKDFLDFFLNIERILMLHINSINVFELTVEEVIQKNIFFSFPCKEHTDDILSKAVYFYTIMRIQQYYMQEEKSERKRSAEKRKESKLQFH